MKKFTAFIFCLALAAQSYAALDAGIIRKAMSDEMARNEKSLREKGFPKPFYIGYKITETHTQSITALFGSISVDAGRTGYQAYVDVRVGDKKFDNTGYQDSRAILWRTGAGYDIIRNILWEATDYAYKNALEQLSRKKSYKEQKNITEIYDDFSSAPKTTDINDGAYAPLDKEYMKELAEAMSDAGAGLSTLEKLTAGISAETINTYFLNTEGSSYSAPSQIIKVTLNAAVRAKNGFVINKSKETLYGRAADLPSKEELLKSARDFAVKTSALANAAPAEMYIGPVLLEGAGAVSFLQTLFLKNIANTKPLWIEDGTDRTAGEFRERLGLPVISHIFDVYDDPLAKEYKGKKLLGFYTVDDEGVAAEKVRLVKNGKLINLLTTRSLIKGQKKSNGHGRTNSIDYPRAKPSNLFFIPDAPVPAAELKARFLEKCKELDLEYCIKITEPIEDTFNAYKIYAKDGREEPLYGAEVSNLSLKNLRDIVMAGDDTAAYNFGGYERYLPTSIITPSFITGDMEIMPTQKKADKKPMVAMPSRK